MSKVQQVYSAFRIFFDFLKINSSRTLHNGNYDGVLAKNLQDTQSMMGVLADSSGRTKNKLLAENEEKIGPCTDLLRHVARPDDLTFQEEPKEMINRDPNISMWTMYKVSEEPKIPAKKLKTKFRKLKDSIKNYYVDRVEETEELLNQVDKPFVIGKLNKETRKNKTLKPVELEMFKISRINQVTKSNNGGYKQYNRSNHANKPRPEVNSSQTGQSMNPTSLETLEETIFEENRNSSNEGGVEIANMNIPSMFHSKNHEFLQIFNRTPHLLFHMFSKSSLTSQVQLSHMFSTCAACNNKTCPRIMPPKSLTCEPEVKLPKCPKPEGYKWPCCPKITLCGCDPPHPRSQTMDCDKGPKPKFPFSKNPQYMCPAFSECQRNTELIKERPHECCMQKKPCDSFVGPVKPFITATERQELSLGQNYWTGRKEQKCNYHTSVINRSNRTNLFKRPQWKFITALGGPEMSLVEKGQKCAYHTTALRMDKEGCTSCNKAACETCFEPAEGFCCPKKKIKEETEKVCMKINCIPGNRKKEKFVTPCSLDECEKICLPCCQPARDPPSCDDRAVFKKVCKRKSNPSPSFSECGTGNIKTEICECLITIKPKCKSGSKVDASPESNS